MTVRDDLPRAIDELAVAAGSGDARRVERCHRNARALATLAVPVHDTAAVCPECEVGAGRHVEGCSLAPHRGHP